MKITVSIVIAAILFLLAPPLARACFSCGNWTNWGERIDLCASPSEALWEAQLGCTRSNCGGATECAAWLAGYDACESSGDPACSPPAATDACNACVAGATPYEVTGCDAENDACSADQTGCVTCAEWLAGGSENNVCQAAYGPAFAVSDCACDGSCAGVCASACGPGYLEPPDASFACAACVGQLCTDTYNVCAEN
jgi:hypothetical protein